MRKIKLLIGLSLVCAFLVSPASGQTPTLLTFNGAGTGSANDGSSNPIINATGRFVAFNSLASNLTATKDTNDVHDAFIRDLQTGVTTLVSVSHDGSGSGNDASFVWAISPDGRFVLFVSRAWNLVSIDPGGSSTNIYVRDMIAGKTSLVSVNSAGTGGGNFNSSNPSMSPDGRFVVFDSASTNLVTTRDINNTSDVYLRDLQTGTTTLISINSAGNGTGNGPSGGQMISRDGRYVVFGSQSTNLTPISDTNRTADIFIRDLLAGTTTLISTNSAGTASANSSSGATSLSADGRFLLFLSNATDLGANLAGGPGSIYVRDLMAGTTTLVNVNSAGTGSANGLSRYPIMSGNGRYVAFRSLATDLVEISDTNKKEDIFVHDLRTRKTTLVTVNREGTATGHSPYSGSQYDADYKLAISDDGRFVAFHSIFNDLVLYNNDQSVNQYYDVFVRDLLKKKTSLASINKTGNGIGNDDSIEPLISANGKTVVFTSIARNLAASDTNAYMDIYSFKLAPSDLSLSMADTPDPVLKGKQVTYTLKVSNKGPSAAAGVILTDTLPAGARPVSVRSSVGSCIRKNGTAICNIGSLASGATATITVVLQTAEAGSITYRASVTHNVTDPSMANNVAVQTTSVVNPPE